MDKRRTIYKLWDLRGCIFISMLNLIFGALLLAVMKAFPRLVTSKIQESLLSILDGDMEEKYAVIQSFVDESLFLFHSTAIECLVFALVALVTILILIRLSGKIKIRKIIAWLVVLGITVANLSSVLTSLKFLETGSLNMASQGFRVLSILGFLMFIGGLCFLFVKTLKDLTQPRSVH